ncbi:hypothetical protein [Sedimenticola hydrogenitrophicus]|uniref:hypothetical protein n=1 Tax=Sedimenticola hydrogenitrophicus TaxID=2967975 RepID=UPI0021A4EF51|nr:hypothetical protein [Sedimenticola hydrogenitrophicus]
MSKWRYRSGAGGGNPALWGFGLGGCCLAIIGFVTSVSVMAAGEDDYLSALHQEAGKVDGGGASSRGAGGEAADGRLSRESFESELKEKYAGSAVFYSKLAPGSQEEIYQEYQSGASISELRKKIMDRFLHR